MTRVKIFYGDNEKFQKIIPDRVHTLTEMAFEFDKNTRQLSLNIPGETVQRKKKKKTLNKLVIHAEEYAGVQEHVLMNFSEFLCHYTISNLYIQNPPEQVLWQVQRLYSPEQIEIEHQVYNHITAEILRKFNNEFDNKIFGQTNAKEAIMRALFSAMVKKEHKPLVILFYGESGIGKTETVQFLGRLLEEQVFRKQFSMFQNNEFATYLFGGKYNEKSFTQDLLRRSSNLVLLDEFDKANPIFYSAFYQLFDEGIIEDSYYRADLKNTIIICTSNYHDVEEIRNHLGEAIYNRFDFVIKFDPLTLDAKEQIARKAIEKLENEYENIKLKDEQINNLFMSLDSLNNAREINRIIREMYSYIGLKKVLEDKEN